MSNAHAEQNDCEDQGFSAIADGCQQCPKPAPLAPVKRNGGTWWVCAKCNASYGAVIKKSILPPMSEDMVMILGRPNFACAPIAERMRTAGYAIEQRAEAEQARVLHWTLGLYLEHGERWADEAERLLKQWSADATRRRFEAQAFAAAKANA